MVGDESYIKYLVCTELNKNPYSEEFKNVPDSYWFLQAVFLLEKDYAHWKRKLEPQAELMASIANPEVFKAYIENKKEREQSKKRTLDQEKQRIHTTQNQVGTQFGEATTYYDPTKGLVDFDGNILIPKEEFAKKSQIGGVAISY